MDRFAQEKGIKILSLPTGQGLVGEAGRCEGDYEINSLTSDFSSFFNSVIDASIFCAAEIVDRKPLHDFPFAAAHTYWE